MNTKDEKEVGITSPNCPSCGKFMDKVEAVVTEQMSGGTVPISTSIDDAVIAWVCPGEKCRKPDK